MKKLLTIMLAVAMLASLACIGASAKVLVTDTFDQFGNDLWAWTFEEPQDSYKLTEIDGNSMLDMTCVVHQSKYTSNEDTGLGVLNEGNVLTTGTWWVDTMTEYKEGESDDGSGLWFANYGHQIDDGEGGQDTYYLKYYPKTSQVKFYLNTERDLEGAEDNNLTIATYDVPGAPGETAKSKTMLKLGFRVEEGKISAFVGDTCIGSFEDATVGKYPSPMLFWNDGGLHTYFDNWAKGDLDELTGKQDNPDTNKPDTDKPDTDKPADTDPTPSKPSNGGAQTGDMAVVVFATMVIALGSAIVVKKVSAK